MLHIHDLVEVRLYASEEEVIQDALRHLLRARPELRVQLAIHHYQTEPISLAKAASLASVSWVQMREILLERGIQPRLGPETVEEAQRGSPGPTCILADTTISGITDTTVLSNFASISQLDLLHRPYDTLYISTEVYEEI